MAKELNVEDMIPDKYGDAIRRFRWLVKVDGFDHDLLFINRDPQGNDMYPAPGWKPSRFPDSTKMFVQVCDPIATCTEFLAWKEPRRASFNLLDCVGSIVETWTVDNLEMVDSHSTQDDYAGECFWLQLKFSGMHLQL